MSVTTAPTTTATVCRNTAAGRTCWTCRRPGVRTPDAPVRVATFEAFSALPKAARDQARERLGAAYEQAEAAWLALPSMASVHSDPAGWCDSGWEHHAAIHEVRMAQAALCVGGL